MCVIVDVESREDMNKLKKNKILYIIVFGLTVGIMGFIIYPLLDYLTCQFITHTKFVYTIQDYIIRPLEFGMIFSGIYCLLFEFRKK